MFSLARWSSASATLIAGTLVTSTVAPLVVLAPASAQTNFSDVSFGYWARPFIQRLAAENIIAGFPDGTFRPDQPVTRAQFAAIIRQAFSRQQIRQYRGFTDIAANYWATPAIQQAFSTGFMSGFPDGTFRPDQRIPKVQALVSLASGLELNPRGSVENVLQQFYRDANQIPDYARPAIAAATQNRLVVNYPNVNFLNPEEIATRADVAAFIYQALVNQGAFEPIATNLEASTYIVNRTAAATRPTPQPSPQQSPQPQRSPGSQIPGTTQIPRGTRINVRYPGNREVNLVIAPGETVPTTLLVANPIRNSQNQILVPADSQIRGRFIPVRVNNAQGAQFVADRLVIGNTNYDISAVSTTQFPVSRQEVQPGDLRNAVTTTAARSILRTILGSEANLGNILAEVLTGGSGNPSNQNRVIVIDPQALELVLESPLTLR